MPDIMVGLAFAGDMPASTPSALPAEVRPAQVPGQDADPGGAQATAPVAATGKLAQGIGYAAGFTSGLGLHYRLFFPDGWGAGATGLYGFAMPDGNGVFSGALEGFKTIFLADWGRFYLVGAFHRAQPIGRNAGNTSATLPGLGLGIDFGPQEGFHAAVEAPYTFYFDGNGKLGWNFPVPNLIVTYQY
jgi:hypothetical protein